MGSAVLSHQFTDNGDIRRCPVEDVKLFSWKPAAGNVFSQGDVWILDGAPINVHSDMAFRIGIFHGHHVVFWSDGCHNLQLFLKFAHQGGMPGFIVFQFAAREFILETDGSALPAKTALNAEDPVLMGDDCGCNLEVFHSFM